MKLPRPWLAWHTFQFSVAIALVFLTVNLTVVGLVRLRFGELNQAQVDTFLALLYWGTYPFVFVALGALAWHAVRSERGDYA